MISDRFLIGFFLMSSASLLGSVAQAQVIPDQTLGVEASTVTAGVVINNEPADLIKGGAMRGTNLFHSFSDFSIEETERIYFDSPMGIDFILGRVTGSRLSTINGLLGTAGSSNAALILMNPNGVAFGENATLDVQGAFSATTASGIQLGENGSFSAANPKADSLLSISPSAFFFSEQALQPEILVKAINQSGRGLFVPEGETLLLMGEDVVVDGGRVGAVGGSVVLAAVSGASVVDINNSGGISIPSNAERGNVRLQNTATVNVRGAVGGSVAITADEIDISSGSLVLGGILAGLGELEGQSGSVILEAADLVKVSGPGTRLASVVGKDALGQVGDIIIRADSVVVDEGARINSSTLGTGNAGSVMIEARDNILLDNASVFTSVELGVVERGGDVVITAANIDAINDVQISAITSGIGNAGDVLIHAEETARFDGADGSRRVVVSSFVGNNGSGQGGNVEITAANIEVTSGVLVAASTLGAGSAGNVTINASERVLVSGLNSSSGATSAITSFTGALRDAGQGGSIEITAANLEVGEGATIAATTLGDGDTGDVVLDVSDRVLLYESSPAGISGITNITLSTGQAGDIEITAANLEVISGAQIKVDASGEGGDAGSVRLNISETARFDGTSAVNNFLSGVSSDVSPGAEGNGGNIEIMAANLEVTNGAIISALAFGRGDAGSVILDVHETARFDGFNPQNGLSSRVSTTIERDGEGTGGNVELTATNLEVTNGAQISASTFGRGNAGNVIISVAETARFDGYVSTTATPSGVASDVSSTGSGSGGNVEVTAANLEVTNGAQIGASTFGQGDAGSVILSIAETARFDGFNAIAPTNPSGAFSSVELGGDGDGNNIEITASNLEVTNGAVLSASTFGERNAGNINLSITEQVSISNDAIVSTSSIGGSGGQIDIQAGGIVLTDDGDIQTKVASGRGSGGNITLSSNYTVALADSDILAFSEDGRGGDIDLSQTTLFSENISRTADPLALEDLDVLDGNGRVDINATGSLASGTILVNDSSFVENSLFELPDTLADTDALIASSCIASDSDMAGSLTVRGRDRLSQSPTNPLFTPYSTGSLQPVPTAEASVIQEPQGVYPLASGRLVISHPCE